MKAILEPTDIQGHKDGKYNDSDRDTKLKGKVHKSLYLASKVQ